VVTQYPMGNGIASGGTSIPHFLQSGERHSIALENEYSRIVVEQGVIGLLLWAGFIIWLLARFPSVPEPWSATRRLTYTLCLVTVLTGMIGVGMLVSIPQSCIFLLCTGWMAAGARTFEHEQQPVQELIRPRQLTRRYA
ncbi:MAG TPA: hypothetical protein VEQ63_00725, partial [Bryobacteraceae bacterium]|nr:hypothetical protein [Bryobacteraceae bacterium]